MACNVYSFPGIAALIRRDNEYRAAEAARYRLD